MRKYTLVVAFAVLVSFLAASCGASPSHVPQNPFQVALSRMPKKIMEVQTRKLWMKGFVFNDMRATAKSRGLATHQLLATEDLKDWLLSMGHNASSSTDSAVDLGTWRHTEFLNPSTWLYNCYDISRDHELIKTEASIPDFKVWMERHNYATVTTQPALYLAQSGFHRDSVVFGSGVVVGEDGAAFICREVPGDGTLEAAFGMYDSNEPSLLDVDEIREMTGRMPEGLFTGLVCKLDSSVSDYNHITGGDDTGMSGVPLTSSQTAYFFENGRPKTLSWFSVAHVARKGTQGLQWEFMYDNEEEAGKDLPILEKAILETKGRFTGKNWWSEDLHLGKPEITRDGKFIKVWAEFNIEGKTKEKLLSGNMTPAEKKDLWFEVRALFDLSDKFLRRDYGILWQGY